MTYDSRRDTLDHIAKVDANLNKVSLRLAARAAIHDASKLQEPEKSMFDEFTPKLAQTEYGSDEYKSHLAAMGEALRHHYEHNTHHPEHFDNGVAGMDLLDVIEMVCDWQAATQRMKDGDLRDSLQHNFERFGIEPQLASIIRNTVEALWPATEGEGS